MTGTAKTPEKIQQLRAQLEQTRQALRASEARFRNVIERNADGVLVVDRDGVIRFVNRTAEMLLGRPAPDLVGQTFGFPLTAGDTTELDLVRGDDEMAVVEMRVVESEWEGRPVYLASLRDVTARKQRQKIEQALDQSRRHLRALFENMIDAVLIADDQARYVDVNPAACALLGYSREELLQMSVGDISPAPDDDRVQDMWQAFLAAGRQSGEFALRRKDGSLIQVDYHAVAGFVPGRHLSVIRDITERKRADEALREALSNVRQRQREVSALLQASRAVLKHQAFEPAARAIFDTCKDLLGATSGYVALLTEDGAENEVLFLEAGGLPCTVDPELPMPIRGLREQAYRTGQPVYHNDFDNSEWVDLMPEGHVRLDNVLFAPLVIGDKVVGLLGLANKSSGFTDGDAHLALAFGELAAIALRNSRTLEALQESETRYRSLIQRIQAAVVVHDADTQVVASNPTAQELLGLTQDQMLGKAAIDPAWKFLREDGTSMPLEEYPVNRALATGRPLRDLTVGIDHPDSDDVVWVQVGADPVLDHKAAVRQVIVTFMDITERVHMEEQVRAALREKEVLLKEIHHRVKNNLQVVSSLLDFQADYVEGEQTLEALRDSQRRVRSMAFIHDQLYRARDLAQIDFADYIQNLASDLFAAYRVSMQRRIDLHTEVQDVFLEIKQAIPCGLIINELVSNALKYAFPPTLDRPPDAKNEIRVTFHLQTEGAYELVVSDNGVGLPPDFFPNESSLGMFLIHTFARQLGGTVEWSNGASGGTTCRIVFPMAEAKGEL